MILIDIEEVRPKISPEWQEEARKAIEALNDADRSSEDPAERKKARKAIIDNPTYQAIWRDLKPRLSEISYHKCWYCETNEARSDTAVDHFRPKSAVKECPEHDGYWWIAFSWENYRYCCQFCNEKRKDQDTGFTGGKGTCFPLVTPETRVFEPGDLYGENPVLLDPFVKADVMSLAFEEDGTAQPRWQEDTYPILNRRARESILLYNLNKKELKERRQTMVCLRIKDLITRGDKYFQRMQNNDPSARDSYNEVVEDLLSMVSRQAEYSAAAMSIISIYRDHPWVDAFVSTRFN
jgi:5-methylcytosine-specific restriction endonuclease McrA